MASNSGSMWDQSPIEISSSATSIDCSKVENKEKSKSLIDRITSKFNWEHKCVIWTIDNISEAVGRNDKKEDSSGSRTSNASTTPTLPHEYSSMLDIDYINSNPFEAGSDLHNKSVWSLSLYKQASSDPQYLGLFLHLLEVESDSGVNRRLHHNHSFDDFDSNGIYFKYHMSVLNCRGTVIHSIENNSIINIVAGHSWGEDQFIPLEQVRDPLSTYVAGNKLCMKVDLWLFQQLNHNVSVQELIENPTSSSSINMGSAAAMVAGGFGSLLENLWSTREFADITVQCGEKTFAVHKCIIASSSSVFRAMFNSDMSEASNNLITISDTDASVLEIMFAYLYTRKIPLDWDWTALRKVMELIDACEKYEIKGLKELCFEMICDKMNLSNIGEITVLIHLYNAEDFIKASVYKFIIGNAKILQQSENFINLVQKNPAAFAPIILSNAVLNNV